MKPYELDMTKADHRAAVAVCDAEWSDLGNDAWTALSGMQAERARVVTAIDAAIAEAKHNAEQFPVAAPMVDVVVSRLEKLRTAILAGHQEESQ